MKGLFYLFLLLAFSSGCVAQLTCLHGTISNLSTCVADTANGQECITAYIASTVLNTANSFVGYFCGVPSEADELALGGVDSCTSANNCTNVPPTPPTTPPACNYPDMASCIANYTEGCAWCEGSAFNGVSFCFSPDTPCSLFSSSPGSLIQTDQGFTYTPGRVCTLVSCPTVPEYTVNFYTREYLIDRLNLPGVEPVAPIYLIAGDIYPREVYTLDYDASLPFCEAQEILTNWCGVNEQNGSIYSYCVVSEVWPQYDVTGWMKNSSLITARAIWPSFPAICACNIPGRAVFIPADPIVGYNYYMNICQKESVLLAFYILLMIIVVILMILVIMDTVSSCIIAKQRKKSVNVLKNHTLKVKFSIILYYLMCIPSLIIFIQPKKIGDIVIASYVIRLLGVIFLVFAYNMAAFTFGQLVLRSNVFGKTGSASLVLSVVNWSFVLFITVCLLVVIAILGVFCYKVEVTSSPIGIFNITNYLEVVDETFLITKVGFVLLGCTMTIIVLVTFFWFFYTFYIITSRGNRTKGAKNMRSLLVRNVLLLFSIPFALLCLGSYWYLVYFYAWVKTSSVPALASSYDEFTINQWIMWTEFVCEIMWITLIAYAMRSVVKNSFLFTYLKEYAKSDGSSSRNSGMSSGTASRGAKSTRDTGDD